MPELPEVETIRRQLAACFTRKWIKSVRVLTPAVVVGNSRHFIQRISGEQILNFRRHGKFLFVDFSAFSLRIHLRMTGRLLTRSNSAPAAKETHVVFKLRHPARALHYQDVRKFGRLEIVPREARGFSSPDAFLADVREIFAALRRRRGMMKHALLNQRVLAGLGNIYVDECLHAAHIHPRQKIQKISSRKLMELSAGIQRLLKRSIKWGGTSFRDFVDLRNERGGFRRRLKVYGREGRKCPCGGVIKKIVVAGRGTHFCPSCQRFM